MKNHQFAIQPVSYPQIIKELKLIHFYESDFKQLQPAQIFKTLLFKAFVTSKSHSLKIQHLKNLMATPNESAFQYLNNHHQITVNVFYNVALQLLHFEVHLDFELNKPLVAMRKIKLPFVNSQKLPIKQLVKQKLSTKGLLKAWYLLLNTHTKLGQTYLDDLASDGYLAQFNDLPKPLFINGKAQPVFDVHHLIHEVVYVEAPLDTDHDGQRDLLRTDIIRPSETNHGLKVPVLFTASPYNLGINDEGGKKLTHHVNLPLKHKQPQKPNLTAWRKREKGHEPIPQPRSIKETTEHAEASFHHEWTYTLNDYFLARGFAIVYSAGVGTRDSQGLRTVGSPAETIGAKAVIEWLTGKRHAFTNPTDHVAISAWWSSHSVAMTGRSYLGTLSQAVASTGVLGLKTCIVEAGISSWYDYYRENGLVTAPGGFQGEDCDVLAEETFSRQKNAGDYHQIKPLWKKQLRKINQGQDRTTGNYNQFWDARNYLKNMNNVKADVLIVHGLNDWNVKPINAWHLWHSLPKGIHKKLILHQGQHIYINNFQSIDFTDLVNLWISNKLYGVQNSADQLIPNVTVQDNVKPETWRSENNWQNGHKLIKYHFNQHQLSRQGSSKQPQSYQDQLTPQLFNQYCHYNRRWYRDLLSNQSPMKQHRLLFKTVTVHHDVIIEGQPQINLRIKSSRNFGLLSAMLVDYGKCKRLTISPQVIFPKGIYQGYNWKTDDLKEFKFQKHPTPFKEIVVGHLNLQNRHSAYQVDNLRPNQWVNVSLKLQPTFFHLLAGHQLGLAIFATDFAMTIRGNQQTRYMIDPQNSNLIVPTKWFLLKLI